MCSTLHAWCEDRVADMHSAMQVLQANSAMLVERLQQSGLHGVTATILPSKAANGSLHDQVNIRLPLVLSACCIPADAAVHHAAG